MADSMADFLDAFPGADEADVALELNALEIDTDEQNLVLEIAVVDYAKEDDWFSALQMAVEDANLVDEGAGEVSDPGEVEQEQIVVELAAGVETLSEEEFDDLYNQLDMNHQMQVDENIRNFANNAVGDEHWDSDD